MGDVAIKFENISKQYRLGTIGTGTIRHDLKRWWTVNIRGKDDPYLKIGSVNERNTRADSDYVWALRDINLEVKEGEVLGIIGKNGAGKSTLLKILSRVTSPTTGQITAKGRIASLLEVGTGFHPEMTGRENIFMNGSIMGMSKQEIRRKLDEIIDFSGVERYIDTPVKRYSTGMNVRLGFAIAAHLEPDILVVDEVLAVGDAEFQKKAIGKMQDVSKSAGRTVLFVSHNMAAIKALCKTGVLLNNGSIEYYNDSENVVNYYLKNNIQINNILIWDNVKNAPGNDDIKILSLSVSPQVGNIIDIDSGCHITLKFVNLLIHVNLDVTFDLYTSDEIHIFHNGCLITKNSESRRGIYTVEGVIPARVLNNGLYKISVTFGKDQRYVLYRIKDILSFEIENSHENKGNNFEKLPGILWMDFKWQAKFVEEVNLKFDDKSGENN